MLAADRRAADAAGVEWQDAVCREIAQEMRAARGMTIERMVELGGVSRSSFYRFDDGAEPGPDADMELRDAIQRIAVEMPGYGRPRITAELRRRGWIVNPKRVYRIMREDNLLCVRRRKYVISTDSRHGLRVYPNLAGEMKLTGLAKLAGVYCENPRTKT